VYMDDYTKEVTWQSVIEKNQREKSLFAPTEWVGFVARIDDQPVWRLDPKSISDFELKPFILGDVDKSSKLTFFLELSVDHQFGLGDSLQLEMRWKSKYYNAVKRQWHMTFRPTSIFVLVPFVKSIPQKGRLEISSIPDLPYVKVPLGRRPKTDLRAIHRTMNKLLRSPKNIKGDRSYGFRGGKAPIYPIIQNEVVFDAFFGGNNPPEFSGTRTVNRYWKNIVGTRTPGFRRIRGRRLPINDVDITIIETRDDPSYYYLTEPTVPVNNRWYYGTSTGTYYDVPPLPSFDSNVTNRCLSKAEERAGMDIQANIAQDVAQFGQLNRLIGGTARRIATSIHAVKARNYSAAVKALTEDPHKYHGLRKRLTPKQSVADNWLALQYGWKPLLQDIDGLMRLLSQIVTGGPQVVRVKARAEGEKRYTYEQGPFVAGQKPVLMEVMRKDQCKISLSYTYSSHLVTYLQQVGFTNPINLAWEILPYSFVVDWFVPIGPYLSSISAYQGLVLLNACQTQYVDEVISGRFQQFGTSFGFTLEKGGSYFRHAVIIKRRSLLNFPVKELPHVKNGFSVGHSLNAIALMTTAFKR